MDLSRSTQGEQENEQPQQVSSHSLSAHHTNTSPLIVSIPHSIRQQHITDTAFNDTRFFVDTPSQLIVSIPYPMRAQRNTRSNKLIDINSSLARKRVRLFTRTTGKKCQPSSNLQGASCTDIPPAKRVHDIPKQLASTSRQYENDDSDSTCIQQYESDSSQQSDGENSETDDDATQQHSIATSSQTILAGHQNQHFNEIYDTLFEARAKWYNLGLALGIDTGTLDSIKQHNIGECEACLREALKQRDNTTKLIWTDIVKALRKPSVGKNGLADQIQRKYVPNDLATSSSKPSDPTPECVLTYALFLKKRYNQMSSFPDDWPPPLKEKFTKLALIERKICLTEAVYTQSIEYDYATGNVDNIVERKQAITLEQIFQPLPGDSKVATPNRYTVVMDGAPGVGKTTLSRKICIDWAQGKLIKDHHIVILKPLRELRGHTAASLTDLLKADDPELREQMVDHIQKTAGSGVMFIFDGFDELSSEQRSDMNTLFWEIIRGNCLHNCSVLVTSRSYASGPLQEINRVNRNVEVLGFKVEDIKHCIKQNITDKEKAEKLIRMLKERLDIVSLCYIPLNCRIILYVYKKLGTLPDTLTQLYEVFILYTVKHYNKKFFQREKHDINAITYANSIEDLPDTVIKCLDSLSELAYIGMTQDKLVFNYKEVTQALDTSALSLGLLNLIQTSSKERTEAHYYQFLHLTIQEFLAARHIALTKSNEEKLEFITSKIGDDKFRMTLLFLSGLTKLDFLPVEQAFPAQKSLKKPQFLFLAHLLYESRQTTYNWLLPCLVTNSLNLSGQSLSQFDCLVLANFLALTPKDHVWDEINLSQCSLSTDQIELLVSKKQSQRDISALCLTKRLYLCSKTSDRISQHSFRALFEKDSKLEYVEIPTMEFKGVICCKSPLGEALLRAKGLQELGIKSYNKTWGGWGVDITCITKSETRIETIQICSGLFQNILESVEHQKVTTMTSRKPGSFEDCSQCASSGSDAWDSFCNVIKNSNHIRQLHINKSHFNAHDISLLMAALQNKRNLRTFIIEGRKMSHESLIHLRNNLPVNVHVSACISLNEIQAIIHLKMFVHRDNYEVYIQDSYRYRQHDLSEDLITALLEEDLPSELQGITVTTKSFMSKALLRSVGNSKIITSLTVADISDEKFTKCAGDFRDMLMNTKTLQTLKLISCELNDTSIKQLEDGLSHNEAVALKLNYYTLNNALKVRSQNLHELNVEQNTLTKEEMRHLSEIVTTCKQLRVLKVRLEDNSDTFFHALTDNQNLEELSIQTTGKMMVVLFQTLLSTSITTLDSSKLSCSEGLGNEGSLAFKEFIHRNKALTVLRANGCGVTDEAFNGITFTHESPLRELSLSDYFIDKGWTELFHGLCSSCITTLDVSGKRLYGEECCTALKCLLINNKTLTVLRVRNYPKYSTIRVEPESDIVCCIADALSQKCSLTELTIRGYTQTMQGWINLFESLYENTTLNTLNCDARFTEFKSNNDVAKSVCEMLKRNQGLQNLNIADELIEGNLKEFAMAYIQRKPVLNLTVGELEKQLVNEIEELETDTDKEYNITSNYLATTIIELN